MARKKKTEEQMQLFEEGGLKDEGGTVDPVSGNDVPSGSTQAEVRDDIPAQLSEGEFVLPADVVRYIGLENLMELRSKAKQGLSKMEAMGQMGNSEEATMDDSSEYDAEIDDLIEDFNPDDPSTLEFNVGGAVLPNYLGATPPQQQFSYGFMPPPQQGFQAPGYSVMPQQTQFITDPARVAVGQGPVAVENRTYVGPNGEEIIIPFYDGKPMQGYTIPAGYKYKKPEEAVAETPEVKAPVVQQPDGGGGDGPSREEEEAEADRLAFDAYETRAMVELEKSLGLGTKVADAWAMDPRSQLGPNATLIDHVKALAKVGGPVGAVATGINTTMTKSDFYDTLSNDLDITRDEAKELIKLEAIPQYVDKVTTGERDSVDVTIGGNTYGVTQGGGVVGGRTTLTPSEAARRAATAATQITTGGVGGSSRGDGDGPDFTDQTADALGLSDRSEGSQASQLADQDAGLFDSEQERADFYGEDYPGSSSDSGSSSSGNDRWCCSRMVHHDLWTVEREFARLSAWSRKQPSWWRSGYPVWGKIVAKHLLGKQGFWTDVMQAFYDNHVMKKPRSLKSTLADIIIFPGSFVCGLFLKPKDVAPTLARLEDFK